MSTKSIHNTGSVDLHAYLLSLTNFNRLKNFDEDEINKPPQSQPLPIISSSSPRYTYWAGGAFENSPPPTDLPMPTFLNNPKISSVISKTPVESFNFPENSPSNNNNVRRRETKSKNIAMFKGGVWVGLL